MAGGYLGLGASLSFPGEEAREKYAREKPGFQPNPLFESIFRQLQTQLDPKTQRQRTRRQFGRYSDSVVRGTQEAMNQLQAGYARRGIGGSGIAARAQGGLVQNQAFQQAQLPGLYQEALAQKQQAARLEALNFLLQILQERRGITQANEAITARKQARPTGLQRVLGDINAVGGTIGGLFGILGSNQGEGGTGGSGLLGLL